MASMITTIQSKLGYSKKALLLGAGFVTRPTAQILSDAGVEVTVGMYRQDSIQSSTLTQLSMSHSGKRAEASFWSQKRSPHLTGRHRYGGPRRGGCKVRPCHFSDPLYLPYHSHQVSYPQEEECRHNELCLARNAGVGEGGQRGRHYSHERSWSWLGSYSPCNFSSSDISFLIRDLTTCGL